MKICVLGAGEWPWSPDHYHHIINERPDDIDYVDIRSFPHINIKQDLNEANWENIASSEYDIVIAMHVAEHMDNRINFMNECRRILKLHGLFVLEVPNWKNQLAHSCLEHKNTFSRYIFAGNYTTNMKWKCDRISVFIDIGWHRFFIYNEIIGRWFDKYTPFTSILRFYLWKI